MATFRIPFPERETPSTLLLTGARVTIGRRPDNTVQIIDRTLSGIHAEMIMEAGHYRLHDRGSSNGTFVNGERVTDFHLTEPCQITFGSVDCDFDPHAPGNGGDVSLETLPSHGEVRAVQQENTDLKAKVETLQREITALQRMQPAAVGEPSATTLQKDYAEILNEREALQEEQHRQAQEIARLRADLAVLQRDRENLQRALGNTRRELDAWIEGSSVSPADGSGGPGVADAPPGMAAEIASKPSQRPMSGPPKPVPRSSPSFPGVSTTSSAPTLHLPSPPQPPSVPMGGPGGSMPAPKAVPVARAIPKSASGIIPVPKVVTRAPAFVDTDSGKGSTQKVSIPVPGKGPAKADPSGGK